MAYPQRIDGNEILNDIIFNEIFKTLEDVIKRGGPDPEEYELLTNKCQFLCSVKLSLKQENSLYEMLKPILTLDSMIGFSYLKPHGYTGDFEIIDRMYQHWKSPESTKLHKWDNFFHDFHSVRAVRNRKNYFVNELIIVSNKVKNAKVLNLASGPCTDLNQFFNAYPDNTVTVDCIDMDATAIAYGTEMCDGFIDSVSFINRNAFRFKTDKKYDLIWSAGLFDYFNDKLFKRLLRNMYELLSKEGTLVVGNFSDINPSKGVMEVLGKWFMHHRSENDLIQLAMDVDIPRSKIKVGCEATKVNLFLHIEK